MNVLKCDPQLKLLVKQLIFFILVAQATRLNFCIKTHLTLLDLLSKRQIVKQKTRNRFATKTNLKLRKNYVLAFNLSQCKNTSNSK